MNDFIDMNTHVLDSLLCLQKIPIWHPFVCAVIFFVAVIFKVVLNKVPAAH